MANKTSISGSKEASTKNIRKKRTTAPKTSLTSEIKNLYSFCTSLNEKPSSILVEGSFLTLEYSSKLGISRMIISFEANNTAKKWISTAECFRLTMEELKSIYATKGNLTVRNNIMHFSSSDETQFSVPTWNCIEDYNPIIQIAESLEWNEFDIPPGMFKKSSDFARVNIDTGEIFDIGTVKITDREKSNMCIIGTKLLPKKIAACTTYLSLYKLDKNFGVPHLYFEGKNFTGIVIYPKTLIDW